MPVDRVFFFRAVRTSLFGGHFDPAQMAGLSALLDGWDGRRESGDPRWLAYVMATAYHETARTMQPTDERGSDAHFERLYGPAGRRPQRAARLGNTVPGDGARYHGRGFVRLTWKANYIRMSEHLTAVTGQPVDLAADPDLAKRLDHAVEILFHGMEAGSFTGAKLGDFFSRSPSGAVAAADWIGARRIVNGSDRARTVAQHARRFLSAIRSTHAATRSCDDEMPLPAK